MPVWELPGWNSQVGTPKLVRQPQPFPRVPGRTRHFCSYDPDSPFFADDIWADNIVNDQPIF